MNRVPAALVAAFFAATTLGACGGGGDPYCEAVEKHESTLNSFGQKRTNAAYTNYAKVLKAVAKPAPATIKDDWTALSTATTDIVAAQKAAGISLEEMADAKKRAKLSSGDRDRLNTAYKAFNATTKQRDAVVKNVLQKCDIKLK